MNPNPKHTHDRFFKEAFSRTDVVADFIQAYLPGEFVSQLKAESILRLQESYVDDELGQHYVDLLFTASFGEEPITIALLFEHKSYPEDYPHFQLNQYMLNYWRDLLRNKKPLQPVVPIVVYHGRSKWKERPMAAYFPNLSEQLSQFLPDFRYYLINLTDDPANKFSLLRSSYARLTAGLLKTIRQKQQLKQMLDDLKQTIAELAEDALGEQFVRTALLYVSTGSSLTAIEIITIFRNIPPTTEQIIMSAAKEWIQQGMQQGIQQGMQRGIQEGVKKGHQETSIQFIRGLLRLGMDANTIATTFDMPLTTVEEYVRLIQDKSGE